MIALTDVRQGIADLKIAENDHVYIGKLDNKKERSIGVYGRQTNGQPFIALGGLPCTTYAVRPISLLVHWTKQKTESEAAAYQLFEQLMAVTSLDLGGIPVNYLRMMVPEPQDVGTDDGGVYEYVIRPDLVYERKE